LTPPRRIAPVIAEILEAIEGIQRATHGRSFEGFKQDWTVRLAVQRAIEIISEASKAIPAEMKATQPEIPWDKIRASGNILRHEYFRVADEVVWGVAQHDLEPLKAAILAIRAGLKE
jgi:uncharacterized protein with HEPN domain